MITLAIDTSTPRGSVAVWAGGELVFDHMFMSDRGHSGALFTALERARAEIPRLDRVAVGLGPGSYAGVRVAIAAALGLEFGLGAMLVGLPSVAALEVESPRYLAIGDARRGSFYFTAVEGGDCVDGPRLATEAEVRDALSSFGMWPLYTSEPLEAFSTAQIALPAASILGSLAEDNRGIVQSANLEPIYLREPYITQARSGGRLTRQHGFTIE